jgi:hypothetical protein
LLGWFHGSVGSVRILILSGVFLLGIVISVSEGLAEETKSQTESNLAKPSDTNNESEKPIKQETAWKQEKFNNWPK